MTSRRLTNKLDRTACLAKANGALRAGIVARIGRKKNPRADQHNPNAIAPESQDPMMAAI
jgi:hypothetical protein